MHRFFSRVRELGRPMILGHRGAKAHATENTMAAFALAREHGADGIELDVQLSADGRVIVFHDTELARLAGRGERVTRLELAALQALRIGSGERIPTLEQVLGEYADSDFVLNIEIKSPGFGRDRQLVAGVLELLARYRGQRRRSLLERVLISSFDPIAIWRVRRRAPEYATGYLFHDQEPLFFKKAWQIPGFLRPHALHPEHSMLTGSRVMNWRRRQYALATWTVDDDDDLRRVAALDVCAIISNDPRHASQVLFG